jgi:hypothetical protein
MTTKKPSSFNSGNIMNLVSNGIQAVGQISNAIGNIFGKKNKIYSSFSYYLFR